MINHKLKLNEEILLQTVFEFHSVANETRQRQHTTGQIRGARGSRPFKLVNEIMSLTKVGIYALGVTKIH